MWQLPLPKAFILVVAIAFLLYPGIFLFFNSPMIAKSWTLQDMGAGLWAFVPGRSVARYELLDNLGVLWSGLRHLGAPILGNDVQAAPLFPLTLALTWLPDPYFWNAFVAVRLVLMWFGAFLLATTVLKLERLPAFVFMVCFVGTVEVARWVNHSWQNGLTAGIWLLYFVGQAFVLSALPWGRRRFFNAIALAFCTYALLTCGFPEATLLAVLLGMLVFAPILIAFFLEKHAANAPANLFLDLALGGLTGMMLASPQLFALLENISLEAPGFRDGLGLAQFRSFSQFLTMVTRFGEAAPAGQVIQILGLIPMTLALVWVIALLMQRRADLIDAIAALAISFYMLKAYPVWPAFNRAIALLPIFSTSWFFIYFTPIGLFGFAILAARGTGFIFAAESGSRKAMLALGGSLVIVAALAWAGSTRAPSIDARYFAPILLVFALFLCCAGLAIFNRRSSSLLILCGVGVVCALLQEQALSRPNQFVAYHSRDYDAYANDARLGRAMRAALAEKGIPVADVREASREGKYVSAGIATIDNGATAILTQRAQLFRTGLFDTDWNGYLWLKAERRKDAYRIAGRNIVMAQKPAGDADTFALLSQFDSTYVMFDRQSPGRAFVASRCHAAADAGASLAIMRDERAFRIGDVVVEAMTDAEAAFCSAREAPWRRISIVQDRGSRVGLDKVMGPAIVTLNDSAYPGWRAFDRVSGAELAIRPGNLNFRTVFLTEAREYQVEFVYRPPWLWISLTLVAIAAAAWLGLAIRTFWALDPKR